MHGGYFEGLLSQQMIYRLACLGYEDTVTAYGSDAAMWQACEAKQIRGCRRRCLAREGWRDRCRARNRSPDARSDIRVLTFSVLGFPHAAALMRAAEIACSWVGKGAFRAVPTLFHIVPVMVGTPPDACAPGCFAHPTKPYARAIASARTSPRSACRNAARS